MVAGAFFVLPVFELALVLVRFDHIAPHRKRGSQHHLLHNGKTKVLSWTAFLAVSESVGLMSYRI